MNSSKKRLILRICINVWFWNAKEVTLPFKFGSISRPWIPIIWFSAVRVKSYAASSIGEGAILQMWMVASMNWFWGTWIVVVWFVSKLIVCALPVLELREGALFPISVPLVAVSNLHLPIHVLFGWEIVFFALIIAVTVFKLIINEFLSFSKCPRIDSLFDLLFYVFVELFLYSDSMWVAVGYIFINAIIVQSAFILPLTHLLPLLLLHRQKPSTSAH